MPSVTYQDYNQNTPVTALWLNGINKFVFGGLTSPCAWVRFDGTSGVIKQSYGVQSVTVNSAGNYTIVYTNPVGGSFNCYNVTTNLQGFNNVVAETNASVTIQTASTTGVPTNATLVCVTVFGVYTPSF